MKKVFIITASVIILLAFSLLLIVQISIGETEAELKTEAEKFIEEKYNEDMVIYEVSLSDIKVARAYPKEKPALKFNILIYDAKNGSNDYTDYYIAECLKEEARKTITSTLSLYNTDVYVSDLKWCNPTPDGENETYYYLDKLYEKLRRIPCWKDIDEYQKIENVNVTVKGVTLSENDVLQINKLIYETECHIENLEITN